LSALKSRKNTRTRRVFPKKQRPSGASEDGPAKSGVRDFAHTKDTYHLTQFKDLNLNASIIEALNRKGYTQPTPIQLAAIPGVMTGRDLLGIAQTGTGKTAAFALPILHRLAADRKPLPGAAAARSCSRRRANSPPRSPRASRPMALTWASPSPPSSAASAMAHSARRWPAASTSSSPLPAACSITCRRRTLTSPRPRSSSSTRPTRCSTWASSIPIRRS
jgi:hypothetical protein